MAGAFVRSKLRTTFQALTVRNYRLFASGQLVKQHGVWMQFIAQDWLVLELSNNSATALGLVTGLQFAPVVLLSLYGGKLADRLDRRRLLVVLNAISTALALGAGLLVTIDLITLPLVFAFAGLLGSVNAIENPVRQAFISDLVEPALLPNALGLSSASFNTARIIGPALAGVGIWLAGLGPVFLFAALCYLVATLFVLGIRRAQLYGVGPDGVAGYGRAEDGGRRARPAKGETRIRDGLAYVLRRDDLWLVLSLLLVVGLAGFNFQLTLAVLAKNVFGTQAQQFGLLTTALAVGALAGALVSGARRSRPSTYVVIAAGTAFGLLEMVAGLAPTFWTTAAVLVPTGFFMIFYAQATNQAVQLGVAPEYRGRVMALFTLVFLGTTPVGGPLVGLVSEHLGPRVGLWGGGLISVLAALVTLGVQLHRSGERLSVTLDPLPHVKVVPAPVKAA
ncbi:MAG: MFS transporter [Micromonosporaceae bacterium]|nr:MFS transporter [Micromonosporaceae bacterium]